MFAPASLLALAATCFCTTQVVSALGEHYFITFPARLGYDDATMGEEPCGGFDAKNRTKVTDWPVGGQAVGLVTTQPEATWEINAALVNDDSSTTALKFMPLVKQFAQSGLTDVCFEGVPGNPNWVGRDAVVQLIQRSGDGAYHQCAAVKFVAGGPAAPPAGCINDADVSHEPIIAMQTTSAICTSTLTKTVVEFTSGYSTFTSTPSTPTTGGGGYTDTATLAPSPSSFPTSTVSVPEGSAPPPSESTIWSASTFSASAPATDTNTVGISAPASTSATLGASASVPGSSGSPSSSGATSATLGASGSMGATATATAGEGTTLTTPTAAPTATTAGAATMSAAAVQGVVAAAAAALGLLVL